MNPLAPDVDRLAAYSRRNAQDRVFDPFLPTAKTSNPHGARTVRQGLLKAKHRLAPQLAALGYQPKDITFVAMSHYHADHTANANMLAGSTWIVQQAEYDAMFSDGTVVIKTAPGHTPGHQMLFAETGAIWAIATGR